jgi:hypothetical protein
MWRNCRCLFIQGVFQEILHRKGQTSISNNLVYNLLLKFIQILSYKYNYNKMSRFSLNQAKSTNKRGPLAGKHYSNVKQDGAKTTKKQAVN